MEHAYAQALWQAVKAGKSPKDAVHALHDILKREGRLELMSRIELALKRIAAREQSARPRIYVAHEKDAKNALAESGVHDADVRVDTTLIGGWRLEGTEELVDHSFKNRLLSIYSNVTD